MLNWFSTQSLDQIGERKKRNNTLLENIGTQIYLGSLVGNTARYFIESLPQRSRRLFRAPPRSAATANRNLNRWGRKGRFGDHHLPVYRLPAGEWPALVYINDQPQLPARFWSI